MTWAADGKLATTMESNISDIGDQQPSGADRPLAEPHFDEEATVLSARPVVPLKKVVARTRLTWALVIGLTFAGACVVGMLAAGMYYSRLNSNSSKTLANTETITSGVQARSTETDHPKAPPAAPPRVSVESDTSATASSVTPAPIEVPETSTEAPKKPVARRVAVLTFPRSGGDQERREARREEKERRRDMKRENQENKSSRDLLRIREIFEGPHKP
jgi:type IV secretory pathway VirB10-like protein